MNIVIYDYIKTEPNIWLTLWVNIGHQHSTKLIIYNLIKIDEQHTMIISCLFQEYCIVKFFTFALQIYTMNKFKKLYLFFKVSLFSLSKHAEIWHKLLLSYLKHTKQL